MLAQALGGGLPGVLCRIRVAPCLKRPCVSKRSCEKVKLQNNIVCKAGNGLATTLELTQSCMYIAKCTALESPSLNDFLNVCEVHDTIRL